MRRSTLKKEAKRNLTKNYFYSVLVCILFIILVGETTIFMNNSSDVNFAINEMELLNFNAPNNSEIVNNFFSDGMDYKYDYEIVKRNKEGIIGTVVDNINRSGSFTFGILNALNQFLFQDQVVAGIIILVGSALSFIYWVFIKKVLVVGKKRFFLESRVYYKTKPSRMFYPFKIRKNFKIAKAMLIKNIYYIGYCFTIVGIFVKYYAYLMVPYILAENPDLTPKEAIKLSEYLMAGNKWFAFKLEVSLLGHYLLGLVTFNLYNLFYTIPYREAIHANLYMELRNKGKSIKLPFAEQLKDRNLEVEPSSTEYPSSLNVKREYEPKKIFKLDYEKDYDLLTLVLLFLSFCILGYIWEVSLHLFTYGFFVNRGALFGPWLPIYGSGGILILVLLKKYRKNLPLLFLMTFILCGIVEYGTGWYLETFKHMRYWDYTGYFLNINGLVCLEGLLFFGIGGCLFTYVLAPFLDNVYKKVNRKILIVIATIGLSLFIFDFIYSGKNPNTGEGVSKAMNGATEQEIINQNHQQTNEKTDE